MQCRTFKKEPSGKWLSETSPAPTGRGTILTGIPAHAEDQVECAKKHNQVEVSIGSDKKTTPDVRTLAGRATTELSKASPVGEVTRILHDDMMAGLMPYSDDDMRSFPHRPRARNPLSPLRYQEVRLMRTAHNHDIRFVKVAALYECMKTLASQLDMRSFRAIAQTCKELYDGFNLEDADSYEHWAKKVTTIKLYERPFISETKGSNKRGKGSEDKGEDDDEGRPDTKRIMSTHWRILTYD